MLMDEGAIGSRQILKDRLGSRANVIQFYFLVALEATQHLNLRLFLPEKGFHRSLYLSLYVVYVSCLETFF